MKRIPIIFIILLLLLPLLASCVELKQQVYIVYIGEHSGEKTLNEIEDNHHSYLLLVKKNEVEARASLIYTYRHSINGFAAMLALGEASKLFSNKQKHHMELKEVVSVYQSIPRKYSVGLLDTVCSHNQRASAMKGWGLSQNHGREYAKPELPLVHPIVIGE